MGLNESYSRDRTLAGDGRIAVRNASWPFKNREEQNPPENLHNGEFDERGPRVKKIQKSLLGRKSDGVLLRFYCVNPSTGAIGRCNRK